jgi:hypothetical protein
MSSPAPVSVIFMKWGCLHGPGDIECLRLGVAPRLRRAPRFASFADDAIATALAPNVLVLPLADPDTERYRGSGESLEVPGTREQRAQRNTLARRAARSHR